MNKAMNVFSLSDFHKEDRPNITSIMSLVQIPLGARLVLVVGDMMPWYSGMGRENPYYKLVVLPLIELGKIVISICGNHEYYWSDMEDVDREMHELSQETDGWHHLQAGMSFEVDGWAFIGATLWTGLAGLGNPARSKQAIGPLNDRKCIRIAGKGMTHKDVIRLYEQHKSALNAAVGAARAKGLKTAILSHHAPSPVFIPRSYMHEKTSLSFASTAIDDVKPDVWFFGHIHKPYNMHHKGVWCICNPIGYADETVNFSESMIDLECISKNENGRGD